MRRVAEEEEQVLGREEHFWRWEEREGVVVLLGAQTEAPAL